MKAVPRLFLLALLAAPPVLAADEIALSAEQVQALGITSARLPDKTQGDLSGMPAQVVIPSNQMFIVSTPLPAVVEHVFVGVGDTVNQGQVLARLQSPALAEAQRGLMEATTQAQLAQDNLARDEQLWKDGIIAESRYRAAKGQRIAADAALAERKQMLRLSGMSDEAIAKLQSGNKLSSLLEVTAPISGVILDKSASTGQRLDAAVPLFTVAKMRPLGLEIQAPFASTRGLKTGAEVSVPAYQAKGKLIAIGYSLSGANQTILLRAQIDQGAENLRPGQFVEASIATKGDGKAQWDIPNTALARLQGKALVFVKTGTGFRPVEVQVIHEGAQSSVVSGPLKGDETIAVSGVSSLKAALTSTGG